MNMKFGIKSQLELYIFQSHPQKIIFEAIRLYEISKELRGDRAPRPGPAAL